MPLRSVFSAPESMIFLYSTVCRKVSVAVFGDMIIAVLMKLLS